MIQFQADKKPLLFLLDQIHNRQLALPDFQRSFVWEANATRELAVSVISSFPAGTLLILQGGAKIFAPRAVEQAPSLNGDEPPYLVLDGQQRLTSLYQAFTGQGSHRFFLNVQEVLDGFDLDEAVEVYNLRRAKKWAAMAAQARDLMLPLEKIRDFDTWKDAVVDLRAEQGDEPKKLRAALNKVARDHIKPVEQYQFPVTTLGDDTSTEAVCSIFETLNRTGMRLSVFELITARAFAKQVRLRDMWRTARDQHPVLDDFRLDPYYVLQVIAMTVRSSPKRGRVLDLTVEEIVEEWSRAVVGLARVLEMLRDECGVLVEKWMPYTPMLITLACAWPAVVEVGGPAVGARRAKVRRWFWCATFSARYDNAINTATEQDVPDLLAWLRGGDEPQVVSSFTFDPARWREITVRQRAAYRATIALLMSKSPRDFHTAKVLSKPVIEGLGVDDHHVFPRSYLRKHGHRSAVDSVLNHTLIDRLTNIRVSDKAPSVYLAEMEAELGAAAVRRILRSHRLPSDADGPLWSDEFATFLDWRQETIRELLKEVTS